MAQILGLSLHPRRLLSSGVWRLEMDSLRANHGVLLPSAIFRVLPEYACAASRNEYSLGKHARYNVER